MKLVGKINIEVWDGDPNDPNSKLKQEVEEYNDIHPDFASLWDIDSYVEELLRAPWGKKHTHPISSRNGTLAFAGEQYGYGSIEYRLGLNDDPSTMLNKNAAGRSEETTTELRASNYVTAGYCEEPNFIYLNQRSADNIPSSHWVTPGDFDSSIFSETYKNLMKGLAEGPEEMWRGLVLPLPDNYPVIVNTSTGIATTINPTGVDGTIKHICMVLCGVSSTSGTIISPLKKDIPKPVTLHKFLVPLNIKGTDYISVSYNLVFSTEFRVEGIKEVTYKNKDGKDIRGVQFPLIYGFAKLGKSARVQWVDPTAPRIKCPSVAWNGDYISNVLSTMSGNTLLPVPSITLAKSPYDKIDSNLAKRLFNNVDGSVVFENFDGGFLHEYVIKRYLGKDSMEDMHLPIITSSSNFYRGSRSVSASLGGARKSTKEKLLLTEPPKTTLKLEAVDSADINGTYHAIFHSICGGFSNSGIQLNTSKPDVVITYFTALEEPIEKTKYDELTLTIDQFMEGMPGLCPEINSKTTEE